jgi:5-methylcytosine-specific restriction endonuclease McrA
MAGNNNQGSNWLYRPRRRGLLRRADYRCVYCGAGVEDGVILTIDHVTPRELGGSNENSNLVCACMACNSAKRDLTLRDFLGFLRDRGVDTTGIARRVRRQTAKKVTNIR